jgi:hypothetical protein
MFGNLTLKHSGRIARMHDGSFMNSHIFFRLCNLWVNNDNLGLFRLGKTPPLALAHRALGVARAGDNSRRGDFDRLKAHAR